MKNHEEHKYSVVGDDDDDDDDNNEWKNKQNTKSDIIYHTTATNEIISLQIALEISIYILYLLRK